MFERGPNGYWFEGTVWDDWILIVLGVASFSYGVWLIWHEDKFDYMAPLIGMFFLCGAIVPPLEIMYLLGIPT